MNPFEDIKARLSVLSVVESYIKVKKNGANYKACCPFHKEKSASLIISPAKEIWHCFGCGLGGDIFRFVMLHENISKSEALQLLARQSGIDLPRLESKKNLSLQEKTEQESFDLKIKKGYDYLEFIAKLYHQVLLSTLQDNANPTTIYFRTRGITLDTVNKFKLGFAPTGDWLLAFAKKNNLSLSLLEEISVLKKNEQGFYKDKFSGRLMVPILDKNSRVVGFTARVIVEDPNRPKYLNSSQSDWFNKSQVWYGLNWNSGNIRKSNWAVVVEGNMDVIKATQCGMDNVIASQGTSFTIEQLNILHKFTSRIQIAFDNDNAGIIASQKLFIEATKIGFEVFKILIPSQFKDLDEMLSVDDDLGNKLNIDNPPKLDIVNYLDYELQQNLSLLISTDSTTQKTAILDFLELLEFVNPITRDQFLSQVSELTKVSTSTLASQIPSSAFGGRKFSQSSNQALELKNNTTQESSYSNTKHKNQLNQTLMAFENLIISLDFGNNNTTETPKITLENLELLYDLLRPLISELQEYDDCQEFIQQKTLELELIKENMELETIIDIDGNLRILEQFLDGNIKVLLLDSNLSTKYMNFKRTVSR